MSTGTKVCTRCKERLHMSAFRRRTGTELFEAACIPCRKARQRELLELSRGPIPDTPVPLGTDPVTPFLILCAEPGADGNAPATI